MSDIMSPKSLDLCIQCLSSDLMDINASLQEISQQCSESEKYISWKFPTTKAHCVDVLPHVNKNFEQTHDKLNHYILLLELTVDRFVFLLNLLTEQLGTLINGRCSGSVPQFTSFGLSIKKYWALLVFLNNYFQHINSQQQTYARKISLLEQQVNELPRGTSTAESSGVKDSETLYLKGSEGIAADYSVKGSQTDRTSFVPCEGCHRIDLGLKKLCNEILTFCEKNKIVSLIKDVFDYSPSDSLSGSEGIFQILDALEEDVSNILRLWWELELKNVNSNKKGEEMETARKNDKNNHDKKLKEFEGKIKLLESKYEKIKNEKTQADLRIEETLGTIQKFEKIAKDGEERVKKLTESITQLHWELNLKEEENSEISSKITNLQQHSEETEREKEEQSQEIAQLTAAVGREKKLKSLLEDRLKTLQDKQMTLLDRIEELTESSLGLEDENVELEEKLKLARNEAEARDELLRNMTTEKINAEVAARASKSEKNYVSATIKENEELTKSLIERSEALKGANMQINELNDRVRLLLHFPDLNGPLPPSSGNLIEDMKNQIEANELRTSLLDQQTAKLKNSVRKMEESESKE